MITVTLQDYLASCLKEPVESERLSSFLAQPDTAEIISHLEGLVNQLTAQWQQEAFSETPPTFGPINTDPPKSDDSVNDQGNRPESIDFTDDPDANLIEGATLPQDVQIISSVNPTHSTTHSEETTASMRFAPTSESQPSTVRAHRAISMANATVGKPYIYTLDFKAIGLPDLFDHALEVDTATGLSYESATQTVSGTPLKAGEFNFELTYRPVTSEPDRPTLTQLVKLLVNPDPRSLWKELPSDAQDPYYKPDLDQGLVSDGNIRMVAASVRGRSHAHEGKFRDDDFSIEHLTETGWYLLSVADGAGSARYSRRGAQLACQTVTEYLKTNVDPESWERLETDIQQYAQNQQEALAGTVKRSLYDVLGKAVFAAYKSIESEAQKNNASLKDYATTLITVLAKPVTSGWFVGGFWVGDGGVGIYQAEGEPLLLGVPDGGEYAGQTRFLTMPETIATNFFDRFRFAFVDDFTVVMLMTDGITDPKFQTDNNLMRKEKWDELWDELQQAVSFADDQDAPKQLQDWLSFWSPGNHDDRTIALLYTYAGYPKN
ncbi:PP2C family serine/threonine-protein phosphatase [Spirosoma lituiforme]